MIIDTPCILRSGTLLPDDMDILFGIVFGGDILIGIAFRDIDRGLGYFDSTINSLGF